MEYRMPSHLLRLPEVTGHELLERLWALQPYEPCKQCGHRVHLTDGLCYPCQLQRDPEFIENMQLWEKLYGKGGVPCDTNQQEI